MRYSRLIRILEVATVVCGNMSGLYSLHNDDHTKIRKEENRRNRFHCEFVFPSVMKTRKCNTIDEYRVMNNHGGGTITTT